MTWADEVIERTSRTQAVSPADFITLVEFVASLDEQVTLVERDVKAESELDAPSRIAEALETIGVRLDALMVRQELTRREERED